jgi:hypothetical protein
VSEWLTRWWPVALERITKDMGECTYRAMPNRTGRDLVHTDRTGTGWLVDLTSQPALATWWATTTRTETPPGLTPAPDPTRRTT